MQRCQILATSLSRAASIRFIEFSTTTCYEEVQIRNQTNAHKVARSVIHRPLLRLFTVLSIMDLLLEPLKPFVAFDKTTVDNLVFRLHTQYTTLFLVGASLVVTAQTFIGDPINCAVRGIPFEVMDTYCWIHSTFLWTGNQSTQAHPGIGPAQMQQDEFSVNYYQWVCFTLFLQAGMFYFPSKQSRNMLVQYIQSVHSPISRIVVATLGRWENVSINPIITSGRSAAL